MASPSSLLFFLQNYSGLRLQKTSFLIISHTRHETLKKNVTHVGFFKNQEPLSIGQINKLYYGAQKIINTKKKITL